MQGWLRRIGTLIRSSLSREPTIPFGGKASSDGLPPVLGPREWSDGLVASMADSGTAWYFDRG